MKTVWIPTEQELLKMGFTKTRNTQVVTYKSMSVEYFGGAYQRWFVGDDPFFPQSKEDVLKLI